MQCNEWQWHGMVMVRRELKILDETGLPEKNWKNIIAMKMNEIATKKKLGGSLKKVVCKTPKRVRGQKISKCTKFTIKKYMVPQCRKNF